MWFRLRVLLLGVFEIYFDVVASTLPSWSSFVNTVIDPEYRSSWRPEGCVAELGVRCILATSKSRATGQLLIGVGIVVAHDPLHGPGRALISASGSYRRCVAAKRASGKGWSARGWGSQRSAKARVRVQEIERR